MLVSGTAEPGASVTLYEAAAQLGQVTAGVNGAFTASAGPLAEGHTCSRRPRPTRRARSRVKYAGTYTEKWTTERAPYWPDDFDYRYFQCAPEDQQMPFPKGGEVLVLENLTPVCLARFRLPSREMPILFVPHSGSSIQRDAVVDTVLIEPDQGRFMLTWRASLPMKKSCFDIRQVVVERSAEEHEIAARRAEKKHYPNLGALARDRQRSRGK